MADYIDRNKIFSIWRSMPAPASVVSLAAAISQTPAADVAPVRHGRWKNGGNGLYDTCSACEKEIYLAIPMNYCPECGAMMDGNETPTCHDGVCDIPGVEREEDDYVE